MGTIRRGGQVWRSRHHYCALMGVVGEGAQGFLSGARGGGEKVSITLESIGMMGSPELFEVGCSMPYFSLKKFRGGMMLVCY